MKFIQLLEVNNLPFHDHNKYRYEYFLSKDIVPSVTNPKLTRIIGSHLWFRFRSFNL